MNIPSAGETISHYKLIEIIDQGGMGVVFRADDLRLERTVAVKFSTVADPSADSQASEQFQREAQAAAQLSHPNICPVYEMGKRKGWRLS